MNLKKLACLTAIMVASLSAANAQTTLSGWIFDNLTIGPSGSPAPSTGFGSASALGMDNSYNGTNSVSNPDIQSLSGSSTDPLNPLCWRIRGSGTDPNGGNGWSTEAPVGSQGAKFAASTAGY